MSFNIKEIIVYDNCRGKMVHREKVAITIERRSDLEIYRESLRAKHLDKVPACDGNEPDPQVFFVYKVI